MAAHTPTYLPGHAVTRRASAAVTGGQLVEVTGDGTVGPAAAASTKVYGVAAFDAANGDQVTVHTGGAHKLEIVAAGDAVVAGDLVQAAANGTIAKGSTAPIGLALDGGSAGDLILIHLR